MTGAVNVVLLWERHSYSPDSGEVYADCKGIGRFSIRRAEGKRPDDSPYLLKLNNKPLLREQPAALRAFASQFVFERMNSA